MSRVRRGHPQQREMPDLSVPDVEGSAGTSFERTVDRRGRRQTCAGSTACGICSSASRSTCAAMLDYMAAGRQKPGQRPVHGSQRHKALCAAARRCSPLRVDDGSRGGRVQEVLYRDGACVFEWRPVRPIPEDDDFFENV